MLALSRKRQQSVAVDGSDGVGRMLEVTVLAIKGATVRLGFEARQDLFVVGNCESGRARSPRRAS